jgi:hypothetical protein
MFDSDLGAKTPFGVSRQGSSHAPELEVSPTIQHSRVVGDASRGSAVRVATDSET